MSKKEKIMIIVISDNMMRGDKYTSQKKWYTSQYQWKDNSQPNQW